MGFEVRNAWKNCKNVESLIFLKHVFLLVPDRTPMNIISFWQNFSFEEGKKKSRRLYIIFCCRYDRVNQIAGTADTWDRA